MTTRQAAAELVKTWYRQWSSEDRVPTPRELRQASEMILRHTYEAMCEALPILVDIMREAWPECMRFAGTRVVAQLLGFASAAAMAVGVLRPRRFSTA